MTQDPPLRLLFVCVENSCRSQMAEGFARSLGGGGVIAWSAGSRPSGVVNPKAVESMRRAGLDITEQHSKGLDALPQEMFDVAVTMGCGDSCPSVPARLRMDWDIPDPKEMDVEAFAQVRDRIRDQVENLIRKLS